MSNAPHTYRRRLGRAPSPPTWLWYEQIPFDDEDSSISGSGSGESDDDDEDYGSCSEDGEDYVEGARAQAPISQTHPDTTSESGVSDAAAAAADAQPATATSDAQDASDEKSGEHMDVEAESAPSAGAEENTGGECTAKKDVKGKQRAVEPADAGTAAADDERQKRRERERRKKQRDIFALRPILTIQKSQGFVWNQDLFVPPYIKDRYIASTSPPNGNGTGFLAAPASSYNLCNDYEVDVVEIRVKEGEFADIIP